MIDMENNILNKENVAELMELLECKRYYSKCLKDVTELKEKMKYEATSIGMRFRYFDKESGMAVKDGINFCSDLSKNKLEVQICFLNISFLAWKLTWNFKLNG